MGLTRDDYIRVGMRRRASGLVQQARATAKIASEEAEEFLLILPDPTYVMMISTLADQVEKTSADRAVAEADSSGATLAQNESMGIAKIWLRKVRAFAGRADALGIEVPSGLLQPRRSQSVSGMLAFVVTVVALLEHSKEVLKPAGGDIEGLIAEGKKAHGELSTYDAIQESALRNTVPEAVRDFWEAKGRLYTALKVVNNAARQFYADDLERAARYNMKLVYGK